MAPFLLPRAYYNAQVSEFLATAPDEVLGALTANSEFAVELPQRDAWQSEILLMRHALCGSSGAIWLEFNIPRMGRRADVVVISGGIIFVIEFKVGACTATIDDLNQVWDYALDLKNFHKGSHDAVIAPILVATESSEERFTVSSMAEDGVFHPMSCNGNGIRRLLDQVLQQTDTRSPIKPDVWSATSYCPTPTIVEAARALYSHHSVASIARYDAGAKNLRMTSARIGELAELARKESKKIVCLVTGVPGAGKTLVGLNVATERSYHGKDTHAVFLSGNGPLVAVLREALVRDEITRRKGESVRKGEVREKVKAFIQNVHHFRDEALRDAGAPADHIVVFDEAQRAWDHAQTAKFMRSKRGQDGFSMSEPEFLISYLDRHEDWALIVCLVGGGQEINTGEAGMSAWVEALAGRFRHWVVYVSPAITESEYGAEKSISILHNRNGIIYDDALHLAVPMRSFRSERVSQFIKQMLDCDDNGARGTYSALSGRYPIVITRCIEAAKSWIRLQSRGSERFGLVASSEARRLKPHAIDIRVAIDPIHWFLNAGTDTRSSLYLEDAATEFQVQGLELDWVCVTWDGDLRFRQSAWEYHSFRGSSWCTIRQPIRQSYLRNAYRVLLTRARQGMVIFVPPGDPLDPTRSPRFYNGTFVSVKNTPW